MNISPTKEAVVFLYSALGGAAGGFLFDIFRAIRLRHKASDKVCAVQDLIFWLIATFLTFFLLYKINDGEPRLFIFLGIGLGAVIYSWGISSVAIKVIIALGAFMRRVLILLVRVLVFPVALTFRMLKKPLLLVLAPFRMVKRKGAMFIKNSARKLIKGGRGIKNRLKRI